METNSEQAIYRFRKLYKNRTDIILEKYKVDCAEKKRTYGDEMKKMLLEKNNGAQQ